MARARLICCYSVDAKKPAASPSPGWSSPSQAEPDVGLLHGLLDDRLRRVVLAAAFAFCAAASSAADLAASRGLELLELLVRRGELLLEPGDLRLDLGLAGTSAWVLASSDLHTARVCGRLLVAADERHAQRERDGELVFFIIEMVLSLHPGGFGGDDTT